MFGQRDVLPEKMSTRASARATVKEESPCSPRVKKEKQATPMMAGVKVEKKSQSSQSSQSSAPATAQRNKCKQPSIQRALRRAETLAVMKAAPKRKRSGITPDSCGKAGDPHNLEKGALAACPGHISKSRRRALDEGWDVAAQTAGESKGHPVDLD